MTHIAENQKERPVRVSDLVPVCGIPDTFLSKIVLRLEQMRVVKGERGRNSGYCLTKPAAKTTLLEIIEAWEGPATGEICIDRTATVPRKARRKLQRVLDDIAAYRTSKLKSITVKQLIG